MDPSQARPYTTNSTLQRNQHACGFRFIVRAPTKVDCPTCPQQNQDHTANFIITIDITMIFSIIDLITIILIPSRIILHYYYLFYSRKNICIN